MISIRFINNKLHIKTETMMGPGQYSEFMGLMDDTPDSEYISDRYTWITSTDILDDLIALFTEDGIAWYNSIEEIKGIEENYIPDISTDDSKLQDLKLTPYPFQVVGINFLYEKKKALVTDEMGLGKSLTGIGAAHLLIKEGKANKVLVVCPTSLKYQWGEEVSKFTDYRSIVIDGTPKKRKGLLEEFKTNPEIQFAIINYELVRNDLEIVKDIDVDIMILDEIHRMKNRATQTSKAMKQLKSKYRFGLTGTPMQNKLEELWNIMDWINPKILGGFWPFSGQHIVLGEKFGKRNVIIGYKRLGELRQKIAPYMIRRLKKDVAPELPEMVFNTFRVDMTPEQKKIQSSLEFGLADVQQKIEEFNTRNPGEYNEDGEWQEEKAKEEAQIPGYLNAMIANSDSPELLRMSDSFFMNRHIHENNLSDKKLKSPKLEELYTICSDIIERGEEKVVIFTQFARMQALAVEKLKKLGGVAVLNGSMSAKERDEQKKNFEFNPDVKFFVLTDAGNYGLNLAFAQTLIMIDIPWNPAIFDQRAGRVHRLNSTGNVVNIISILTNNSIDEHIEEVIKDKKHLSSQLVENRSVETSAMKNIIQSITKKK